LESGSQGQQGIGLPGAAPTHIQHLRQTSHHFILSKQMYIVTSTTCREPKAAGNTSKQHADKWSSEDTWYKVMRRSAKQGKQSSNGSTVDVILGTSSSTEAESDTNKTGGMQQLIQGSIDSAHCGGHRSGRETTMTYKHSAKAAMGLHSLQIREAHQCVDATTAQHSTGGIEPASW
jgi:hypothetical protein